MSYNEIELEGFHFMKYPRQPKYAHVIISPQELADYSGLSKSTLWRKLQDTDKNSWERFWAIVEILEERKLRPTGDFEQETNNS